MRLDDPGDYGQAESRPLPVPARFRLIEAFEYVGERLAGMPTPVSLTESPLGVSSRPTSPPAGVNFMAFASRLSMSCRTNPSSQSTTIPREIVLVSSMPASAAAPRCCVDLARDQSRHVHGRGR